MAEKTIQVDPDGVIPTVHVAVKFPHLGEYDVTRWDQHDRNPVIVGRGNTVDGIDDDFRLVRTRDELGKLDGLLVSWVIWMKRTSAGDRSPWSYELRIRQGDDELIREKDSGRMRTRFLAFDGDIRLRLV